ncbi:phosphotransferase [Streptomyces sp. NPDC005706]|uniref:phosphotransferase n=1 Tax=Streptomyces sp. NPDC005706 TaxID=3157169 RepID=UPI0033C8C1C3
MCGRSRRPARLRVPPSSDRPRHRLCSLTPREGQQPPSRQSAERPAKEDGRGDDVVCHGDFGPWNVVWQGIEPVGIIDFDFARPAPRSHDVAYALQYVAPFRDDAECLRYPAPPDRRARLEDFCSAYGLDSTAGIVDAVIGSPSWIPRPSGRGGNEAPA